MISNYLKILLILVWSICLLSCSYIEKYSFYEDATKFQNYKQIQKSFHDLWIKIHIILKFKSTTVSQPPSDAYVPSIVRKDGDTEFVSYFGGKSFIRSPLLVDPEGKVVYY